MADINNGALSFTSTMDNSQMDKAIDETLRRIQGLSDGTVSGTLKMSDAFDATAEGVRRALGAIGAACEQHETAINGLRDQYDLLAKEQSKAFSEGRAEEAAAIGKQMTAVKGEISIREQLLAELRSASNELENEASALNRNAVSVNQNAEANQSLRTRIKELKAQMADMVLNGIDQQSEAYRRLRDELGRLQDIQGDIQTQGSILANDEAAFAGVMSGLQGVAGAASVATGAFALFGEENEEIQKIMLKVQSLMAITMGMQQVAQALNKDSAFMISTIGGLKQWWAGIVAKSTAAQVAETAAVVGNTGATGAQAAAATAGAVANKGLAGAFRLVGTAIKSIPGFGWIAAALAALVGMISHFVSKANEAKKAAQEFYKSLAENAYEPVGKIEELSVKWALLGDDLKAKEQFIRSNAKAFDELGVAVNGVTEAENILVANKDKFIDAQIEKAKAALYLKTAQEKVQEYIKKEAEYSSMPDVVTMWVQGSQFGTGQWVEVHNAAKDKCKESLDALRQEITQGYTNAANAEIQGMDILKNASIQGTQTYAEGSLGAIQQAIQVKQQALLQLTSNAEYAKAMEEIAALQKLADAITGKTTKIKVPSISTKVRTPKKEKTPEEERLEKFRKTLDETRAEYDKFNKWMDSGDQLLMDTAKKEFEGLLGQGASYIEYLKKQRDTILSIDADKRTKEQTENLREYNNRIAEEARQTVLDAFNKELDEQLSNAKTIVDMLNVIEKRRQTLANDGTELDTAKATALNDAEARVREQAKSEYESMLQEYGTFEQKKAALAEEFAKKRAIAEANGNTEMLAQLDKAQKEALSKFALDEMMKSPDWELMFGNLDELSTEKLEQLLAKINGMTAYLGVEFSPDDLNTLKEAIAKMKAEIIQRNPFKALRDSLKDYSKAADAESKKKALNNVFTAASGAAEILVASIKGVQDIMTALGVESDSEAAAIVGDLAKIGEAASQISEGIAQGNPISIIQGSVGILTAAFDLFNFKDRAAERQIKKHQQALKELQAAYEELEWAIEKALGGDVYKGQMDAIRNMESQIAELKASIVAEDSKKKTDKDKIDEWQEQIASLERAIADMYDDIAQDILQTDAKSFADELGDALADAFSQGEDAAKAFEKTVNNVLKNAIVNQLKKNFLEKQLQGVLDDLNNSMGYWVGDNFVFDGLSDSEIQAFRNRVSNIAQTYNQAMEQYSDIFKGLTDSTDDSTLVGAVKGVTEETAEVISGQMQAIRINQAENVALMRNAVEDLARIAANTSYNRHLAKLERIVALMESSQADGTLRANGIQV